MSVRRRLARFNRAVANPLIGRVVSATPGFGAVFHRQDGARVPYAGNGLP
jgi:hypothetical protein